MAAVVLNGKIIGYAQTPGQAINKLYHELMSIPAYRDGHDNTEIPISHYVIKEFCYDNGVGNLMDLIKVKAFTYEFEADLRV